MLAIRLTRTGKTHSPHYRIVVQEKRSKLNGKTVDIIGHYHPAQKEKLLVINKERATHWLSMGAQPSDTVTNLLVKEGVLDKSRKLSNFYTPVKKENPAEPATTPIVKEAVVEEVATTDIAEDSEVPDVAEEETITQEVVASEEVEATKVEIAEESPVEPKAKK